MISFACNMCLQVPHISDFKEFEIYVSAALIDNDGQSIPKNSLSAQLSQICNTIYDRSRPDQTKNRCVFSEPTMLL